MLPSVLRCNSSDYGTTRLTGDQTLCAMLANEYNIELKSFFNGGKKGNLGFEPRTSSSIEHSLYEKHGALQFPSPMMKINYLPNICRYTTSQSRYLQNFKSIYTKKMSLTKVSGS